MRWYLKENPSMPVFDRAGKKIAWQPIGGNYGFASLDEEQDKNLIEDLDKMVGRGGVSHSSESEVSAKKALPRWQQSEPQSQPLVVMPSRNDRPKPAVAAVDPISQQPLPQIVAPAVPDKQLQPDRPILPLNFKPRVGRLAKRAAEPVATP